MPPSPHGTSQALAQIQDLHIVIEFLLHPPSPRAGACPRGQSQIKYKLLNQTAKRCAAFVRENWKHEKKAASIPQIINFVDVPLLLCT
jgi:hypothetical protein